MMLSNVLLPQPLGPIMLTNSPAPTERSTPASTGTHCPSTKKDLKIDCARIFGHGPAPLAMNRYPGVPLGDRLGFRARKKAANSEVVAAHMP